MYASTRHTTQSQEEVFVLERGVAPIPQPRESLESGPQLMRMYHSQVARDAFSCTFLCFTTGQRIRNAKANPFASTESYRRRTLTGEFAGGNASSLTSSPSNRLPQSVQNSRAADQGGAFRHRDRFQATALPTLTSSTSVQNLPPLPLSSAFPRDPSSAAAPPSTAPTPASPQHAPMPPPSGSAPGAGQRSMHDPSPRQQRGNMRPGGEAAGGGSSPSHTSTPSPAAPPVASTRKAWGEPGTLAASQSLGSLHPASSGATSSRSLRPSGRTLGQMGQWFLCPSPLDEHWVGVLSGQVDVEPPYTQLDETDIPPIPVSALERECGLSAGDLLAVPRGLIGAHGSGKQLKRMLHKTSSTGRDPSHQAERFVFPRRPHWRRPSSKLAPVVPPCGNLLLAVHATELLQQLLPPKIVNGKKIKPRKGGEYFASVRVGRVELFGADLPLKAHPPWPTAVDIPLDRIPPKLTGSPLHLEFYKKRGGELLGSVLIPVRPSLLYGFEATCDHNRDPPSGLSRGAAAVSRGIETAASSHKPHTASTYHSDTQLRDSQPQYPGQGTPEPSEGETHDDTHDETPVDRHDEVSSAPVVPHTAEDAAGGAGEYDEAGDEVPLATPQTLHAASRFDPYFQLHMPDAVDLGDGPQWLVISDVFGRSSRSTRPEQLHALPKVKLSVAWRPPMTHPHFSAAVRAQLNADDASGGVGPLETPPLDGTGEEGGGMPAPGAPSSLPPRRKPRTKGGDQHTSSARSRSTGRTARSPKKASSPLRASPGKRSPKKGTSPSRSPASPRLKGGVTQHVVLSPYGTVQYADVKEIAAKRAAAAARSQSRARMEARRKRVAATRIQAGVRMVLARRSTFELRRTLHSAAVAIQRVHRGVVARAKVVAMRRAASAAEVVAAAEAASRQALLEGSDARSKRRERMQAARAKDTEPSLRAQALILPMPGGRVNVQVPATHPQLKAAGRLLAPFLARDRILPSLCMKSDEDVDPEHMLVCSAFALLLGHGQLSVEVVRTAVEEADLSALAAASHPTDFAPEARHAASLLLVRHPFHAGVRQELLLKRKSDDAAVAVSVMLTKIKNGTDAAAGTLREAVFCMAPPLNTRRSSEAAGTTTAVPTASSAAAAAGPSSSDVGGGGDLHDFVIPSTLKSEASEANQEISSEPPQRKRRGRKGGAAAAKAARSEESQRRKARAERAAADAAAAVQARVPLAVFHRWLVSMAFWRPPAQLDSRKLTAQEQDAVDLKEMRALTLDEDLLEGIRAVIGDISPGQFMRVADIRDPPVEVTAVGAALCALLSLKPAGWESVKRVLSRAGFGKKLCMVHPSLLSKAAQRTARAVLRQHPRHHTDLQWALSRLQQDATAEGGASRSLRPDGSPRRLGAHSLPVDALHLWCLFMAFWLPEQAADLHGASGADVPDEIVDAFRQQGYRNPREAAAAAAAAAAAEYADGGDLASILQKKGLNLSPEHLAVFIKYFQGGGLGAEAPPAGVSRNVTGSSTRSRSGTSQPSGGPLSPTASLVDRVDQLMSPGPLSPAAATPAASPKPPDAFSLHSEVPASDTRNSSDERSISPEGPLSPPRARRPSHAPEFVHMRVRLISDASWANVAAATGARGGLSPTAAMGAFAAGTDEGGPSSPDGGDSQHAPSQLPPALSLEAEKDMAPQVPMEHSRKLLGEALQSAALRHETTVGVDPTQEAAAAAVVAAVWAAGGGLGCPCCRLQPLLLRISPNLYPLGGGGWR